MTHDEATRRSYEANVWKAYLYQFLISFQLWWPIWVIYLQDKRGLSLTQINGLETVFWLVVVVAQVPAGAIADRWARKAGMALGAAFLSVAIFVFAAAGNYVVILASYGLWSFALAFQQGADTALLYDSLRAAGKEHEFQRAVGRVWAIASAGIIGGLLIGAPVAAATDLTVPIFISSGISLAALAVALSLKEPRVDRPVGASQPYFTLISDSVRLAYRRPAIRYAVIYAAILGVAAFTPIVFVQPFLREHGASIADVGWLQVPNRVGGVIGALLAYRIVASFGEWRTFVAMPLVLVASFTLLGAWDSAFAYMAFPVVTGVSLMAYPVVADYLNKRIPSSQRATILSVRQLLYSLLAAPIAPLMGFIADEVSLLAVFWASVAFLLPAALVLWLWRRSEEGERVPEAAVAVAASDGP